MKPLSYILYLLYTANFEKFKETIVTNHPDSNYKLLDLYFLDNGQLSQRDLVDQNSEVSVEWRYAGFNKLFLDIGKVINKKERHCQGIVKIQNDTTVEEKIFSWDFSITCEFKIYTYRSDRHIFVALIDPKIVDTTFFGEKFKLNNGKADRITFINFAENVRNSDAQFFTSEVFENVTYTIVASLNNDYYQKLKLTVKVFFNGELYSGDGTLGILSNSQGQLIYEKKPITNGECVLFEVTYDRYSSNPVRDVSYVIDDSLKIAILAKNLDLPLISDKENEEEIEKQFIDEIVA